VVRIPRPSPLASLALSLFATGCIIPEGTYEHPRQSPIYIVADSVQPKPESSFVLSKSDPVTVIPIDLIVYSEDAGEPLHSALFADYKHEGGLEITEHPLGVNTLSVPRKVHYDLDGAEPRIAVGCHSFSLMIFHVDEWDDANKQIIGNPPELASVTWFGSVVDDGGTNPLSDCPDTSTQTGKVQLGGSP
jgi:hypothetical protein